MGLSDGGPSTGPGTDVGAAVEGPDEGPAGEDERWGMKGLALAAAARGVGAGPSILDALDRDEARWGSHGLAFAAAARAVGDSILDDLDRVSVARCDKNGRAAAAASSGLRGSSGAFPGCEELR